MKITRRQLRQIIKEESNRTLLNETAENADVDVPEGNDDGIWDAVTSQTGLLAKWMEVAAADMKTAVENGNLDTADKKRDYTIVLKTPKKDAPGHGEWAATVTAGGSGEEDDNITSLVQQITDRDKAGLERRRSDDKILNHTLLSAALEGLLSMEEPEYETPKLPVSVAHHVITGRNIDMQESKITRRQLRQMILEHMDMTVGVGQGAQPDPKRETEINLELGKIKNIDVEGIDMADFPDFVDAYVSSAEYEYSPGKFRDLSDDEINYLNDNEPGWVYKQVWEQVN